MMKLSSIRCDVLIAATPQAASCDTAQENALVRVEADTGLEGFGEVEGNPWVIQACVEAPGANAFNRSLAQCLCGLDFSDPLAIWDFLYEQTLITGRRGAGICALGAVDIALWDLLGKHESQPIWHLLGEFFGARGTPQTVLTPYASLLPVGSTLREYRDSMLSKALWARENGFKAVKLEVMIKGPFAVNGLACDDEAIVELVRLGREAIGPEMVLMVDVGYCWKRWEEAAAVFRRLEPYNLYFIETPLPPDDLAGYAQLRQNTSIPIAAGELLQTRFEFEDLMDRGKLQVVQPDVGRVGGITEMVRVIRMAEERGLTVVPHCWNSGIGIAATAQVAAFTGACPFIEFPPVEVSESPLRQRLLRRKTKFSEGCCILDDRPGLGVVVDEEFVLGITQPRFGSAALADAPYESLSGEVSRE